jgi:hypothetical protein
VFLSTHFIYNFNWYETKSWFQCSLTDLNTYLGIKDFLRWRVEAHSSHHFVYDGGWHLSYFTNLTEIQRKIESMAHRTFDSIEMKAKESLLDRIRRGKGLTDIQLNRFDFEQYEYLLPEGWEEIQKMMMQFQELEDSST